MKYVLIVAISIALLWFVAARMLPAETTSSKPVVVASIYPYGFLAREIAGNDATVSVLVPPGAEAHDYEPAPKDIVLLEAADLVIANGAGVEPWLDEVKKEREKKSKQILVMIDHSPVKLRSPEGIDPHIWLSIPFMAGFTDVIAQEFSYIDSAHRAAYHQRANRLKQKLQQLNIQYSEGLQNCQLRQAIVAHDAFTYFSREYGITLTPIAGITHEEEPSAQKIAELIDLARSQQVAAVYFESNTDQSLSKTLSEEAQVMSLPLDPVETIGKNSEKDTYTTIMQRNLSNLRKGLLCQ